MANYHKLTVIGKLVSDPVARTFANGGKVCKFGLPIDFTRRKKNEATGQWEGESFIIDVDVFNRPNGGAAMADIVERSLRKGSQVYVEGRLKPNKYKDRNGVETFKPTLVADTIQFLDPRTDGPGFDGGMGEDEPVVTSARPRLSQPSAPPARKPAPVAPTYNDEPMDAPGFDDRGPNDSEIPF